ncbi:hypothetical protein AA0535_1407 [Asaia krungthepensis NRIC 0535]|uniref:Uncharacterized protein n=1 Tax=Asaia krungthepensis NRIC 0535 TaxID=1307925 RepID=A0ABQ0Q297_9PROT|nr:hypothetical protein AA0535_1407 [Asaia krungthepensis NRIC 0535]
MAMAQQTKGAESITKWGTRGGRAQSGKGPEQDPARCQRVEMERPQCALLPPCTRAAGKDDLDAEGPLRQPPGKAGLSFLRNKPHGQACRQQSENNDWKQGTILTVRRRACPILAQFRTSPNRRNPCG